MGLVWDHLEETKTAPRTKRHDAIRKRGFYIANEWVHRNVKRWVFRKSGRPAGQAR